MFHNVLHVCCTVWIYFRIVPFIPEGFFPSTFWVTPLKCTNLLWCDRSPLQLRESSCRYVFTYINVCVLRVFCLLGSTSVLLELLTLLDPSLLWCLFFLATSLLVPFANLSLSYRWYLKDDDCFMKSAIEISWVSWAKFLMGTSIPCWHRFDSLIKFAFFLLDFCDWCMSFCDAWLQHCW